MVQLKTEFYKQYMTNDFPIRALWNTEKDILANWQGGSRHVTVKTRDRFVGAKEKKTCTVT